MRGVTLPVVELLVALSVVIAGVLIASGRSLQALIWAALFVVAGFAHGYAFLMVDRRGFGGSTGCLDWGGPGEQADVKAAINWAGSRPS